VPRRHTASTTAINNDRPQNPNNVNAKAIGPEDTPKGHTHFDKGIAGRHGARPARFIGEGNLTVPDQELDYHDDNGKGAKDH
jgi:hypothetical protein